MIKRAFYILLFSCFFLSCEKGNDEQREKLYALDDIEGEYDLVSLTWKGDMEVGLDDNGLASFDLKDELLYYANPITGGNQIYTFAKDGEYGGRLAIGFPYVGFLRPCLTFSLNSAQIRPLLL